MVILTFLIGVATTFFTIFAVHILCYRRHRTWFQTVVGIIMAMWAVWFAKDLVTCWPGMYRDDVLTRIYFIDGWTALAYTSFIFEVVLPGWTTWRRMLLLAIPFALFTLGYALWPCRQMVWGYTTFLWCYGWTIVIISWFKMKRYLCYIRSEYSTIEKIDVSWLRPVFLFAIIGQLLWLFISFYANAVADSVYCASSIALWLMVLHYSWNFEPIVVEKEQAITPKQSNTLVMEDVAEHQKNVRYQLPDGKLEQVMEEKKLYLEPNLTLKALAQELNTNRTYISTYLGRKVGMTFYDYINQLRIVRAALPLMNEHPEFKFEVIAKESGFASMSTFRRAFAKVTGKTPSQYEDSMSDQQQIS